MPVYKGTEPVEKIGYMTDWISEQAVQFIRRHGQRSWPFFLYLSYTAIHSPEQATDQYLERNGVGRQHESIVQELLKSRHEWQAALR
jgi:hypothetical protein